jgi:kinesin family protein 3/17
MLAMISPAHESFSESLSTLHFAQRAKKIKNRPVINEDLNNRALIRQYETELRNLRNELEQKNKMLQSNELVMQLQEEKEQALQDKNEAIRELEKASRQYLLEREEKLNLEKKIQMMNSQMIIGGTKIEETPQFKSALKNQVQIYENKIQEIEKEKEKMFEDIHESEQYKNILYKQKDIMIALSNKINERDELIANLEEQIYLFDNQDDILSNYYKRINQLEALLIKNKIPLPENLNKVNFSNKKNNDDEKINQLREIISQQENKINYNDVMIKKLMNTVNNDGKVDLNKLLQQMETAKDLYNKINELQKEKEKYKNEINDLNNNISNLKEEIEDVKNNKNESNNIIISNIMENLENIIRNTNDSNIKNELFKVYKYMNDNCNIDEEDKIGSTQNYTLNKNITGQNVVKGIKQTGNTPKSNNNINNSNNISNNNNNSNNNQNVNERLKNKSYINKFINTNK